MASETSRERLKVGGLLKVQKARKNSGRIDQSALLRASGNYWKGQ